MTDNFLPAAAIDRAQRLAGIVHGDGTAADVTRILTNLDLHGLHELAVTLAAMVDIDKSPAELLAWCDGPTALPWTDRGIGRRMISEVAGFYGLTVEEIQSRSIKQDITAARHLCMWFCVKVGHVSYGETGRFLNRDHSTVMVGVARIERDLRTRIALRRDIEQISRQIELPATAVAPTPSGLRLIEGARA